MDMAIVLLIIVTCIGYQFAKGTFVKAFLTFLSAVLACFVAFTFYELLASLVISRAKEGFLLKIAAYFQPVSLAIIFLLIFAIFQFLVGYFLKEKEGKIVFHKIVDIAGRCVCGFFLGWVLSGFLLTILILSPLPKKVPYQKFKNMDPVNEQPKSSFLNADGFITGWYSLVSNGSFRAKRNFTAVHPDFLSQSYLNRINENNKSGVTASEILQVGPKPVVTVLEQSPPDMTPKNGYKFISVALEFNGARFRFETTEKSSSFPVYQLRILSQKNDTIDWNAPFQGTAENYYPVGMGSGVSDFRKLSPNEMVDISAKETKRFVFEIPEDAMPYAAAFMQNNIIELPRTKKQENNL